MNNFLAGKTALVTGSVQGIGLAIAENFAKQGMRLVVHGLASEEQGQAVCQQLMAMGAAETRFFATDLRDVAGIEALMRDVAAWGGVDVLVNNAGMQRTTPIAEASIDTWDTIIAVNLSAVFHTMRLALPTMAERGYGRVINIASVHGLVASPNKTPYVASKFGLIGLSRSAALEYASAGSKQSGGVTVNCICPGWTETAIIEPQIQAKAAEVGGDRQAGIAGLLAEKQPSLRTTDPAEIAALTEWLCSPLAHNMTGTALPIDGGWTVQ